jgi:hypothetical protein
VHPGDQNVSRRQHVEKHEVTERRTTIKDTSLPNGQTTNVNVNPDGSTNVQVNEAEEPVVEERTTVTTRREI